MTHHIAHTISGEEATVPRNATADRIRGHLVALVKPKDADDEEACRKLSEAMAAGDYIAALPHALALRVVVETKG